MSDPAVFSCSVYFTQHVDGSWSAEAPEHGVTATGATQDEARANVVKLAEAQAAPSVMASLDGDDAAEPVKARAVRASAK